MTIEPVLRYDVRRVDPLETDDAAQDEAATVQWAIARLGFDGPTAFSLGAGAVDWVADLAYKRFVDNSGRLLGFDDYFEFGAGLHWRCDRDLPLAEPPRTRGRIPDRRGPARLDHRAHRALL